MPTGTATRNDTPTPASRSTCWARCSTTSASTPPSTTTASATGRRPQAVDRVAALQFDRHGNRIWRQAQALLDSEHTRRAIGQVAVPFGICAEPSNVAAGGTACPFRFRCAGCDHFRTDVSYLPDLQAYLDDLLRNRERLLAATGLDEWARTEATPSPEEISKIRRLIARISNGLDELTADERER